MDKFYEVIDLEGYTSHFVRVARRSDSGLKTEACQTLLTLTYVCIWNAEHVMVTKVLFRLFPNVPKKSANSEILARRFMFIADTNGETLLYGVLTGVLFSQQNTLAHALYLN